MKVKESEVAQSCLTLCDPVDCSLPGSSLHGILHARILKWVAISFSRGIFPSQGSNLDLLHCRQILYQLRYQGSSIESVVPSKHLILCCPFLLLPSLLPSIRVFSMSQLFASGGQRIRGSISALVLSVNIQG